MDAEVRREIDEIWALLREGIIRANEMDRRWNERHEKAMARLAKMDTRMDKFERSLDGIRKLVQTGMKMLVQNQAETRELKREMRAFLQSRNGHNGRSH